MSQQHESGVAQSNVNPFLPPNHNNVPSGISNKPQLSQPKIEVGECSSSGISVQEPQLSGHIEFDDCSSIGTSEQEEPQSSGHIEIDECSFSGTSEQEPQIDDDELTGGGVQPNVNTEGSAHQQQLTEAQIAANYEIGSAEHLKHYRSFRNAAKRGDWESAQSFIENDPDALAARITADSKTVFHVAALCDQWEFILKLLELESSPESIAVQDKKGNTVLHYVAQAGSLKNAKALVRKKAVLWLPHIGNNKRIPPLVHSIWSESKELVWYLSSMTNLDLSPDMTPLILRTLIRSGYHVVEIKYPSTHSVIVNMEDSTEDFQALQPRSLANRAPSVNMVRDTKSKHKCAVELVNHVCTQLSNMSFQEIVHFLTNPNSNILDSAIKCGIEEIVRTLLLQFPDLIYIQEVSPNRNILQAAIEYRQENIVNIIKEMSTTTTKELGSYFIESGSVTLHLAGKLAPAVKLFSVSGAALQMQRELRWFKEAEEITFTYQREWKNNGNETPKDVLRTEHTKLAEEGEKWMKNTAKSCMLVWTLIATVLFAAAFTVPGGNSNDNGIAIFLHTNAFKIFVVSDALGLFSSLTSLLMFLAILTARYELDDFLESLPKKLIIGSCSLFIAIAAMIITFGATLTIVLNERWDWVYVPITLVASFPVPIFVMLQFPLFVQMVQLTYGTSIFRPWPSKNFE